MNKRDFKKYVESVGDSAISSMVEVFDSVENIDKGKVADAVEKMIAAVAAAKSNADVTFDKGVKAFENLAEYSKAKKSFYKQLFKKIYEDFYKELDEAVKTFNSAVPEEVKQENKAAAAQS
ncbi:MAG: hypothetical protein J1F43_03970 [Muribaculaceae bacterium]|nr:hypothetical protein [Muribaculaceae bacterium]